MFAGFVIGDQEMGEKLKRLEEEYLKEAEENPGPDTLKPKFGVLYVKAGLRNFRVVAVF